MLNKSIICGLLLLCASAVFAQKLSVVSPNQKVTLSLSNPTNADEGSWYLKVQYTADGKTSDAIPEIKLGIVRADQAFASELKFIKAGKPLAINEQYTALTGKRSQCSNAANEVVVSFENPDKSKLNLILRAYNDGVAFRYEFPDKAGSFVVKDELTAYMIPETTKRWLEKWNTANEGLYTAMTDGNTQQA